MPAQDPSDRIGERIVKTSNAGNELSEPGQQGAPEAGPRTVRRNVEAQGMQYAAHGERNSRRMDDPDRRREDEKPNEPDQANWRVFAVHNVRPGRLIERFVAAGSGHDIRLLPLCRDAVGEPKVQQQVNCDIQTDHLKRVVDHVSTPLVQSGIGRPPLFGL